MKIEVDNFTLFCAFRYALGRKTYSAGAVTDSIKKNWNAISAPTKKAIVNEIKEAEELNQIGMACDKALWMDIVERYENDRDT